MSPSTEVAVWPQAPADITVQTEFDPHCISMSPAALPATSTVEHAAFVKDRNQILKEAAKRDVIEQALIERVNSIDLDECDAGHEDAFFVGDMGEVYRQFVRWKKHLPRIEPFYGKLQLV